MSGFLLTRQASRDLAAIWAYLRGESSESTANRILAEIYDAMQLLASQPGMGHTRTDVKNPKYRFWTVYRFVIAYRTDRHPLTISGVVHGARDFGILFH